MRGYRNEKREYPLKGKNNNKTRTRPSEAVTRRRLPFVLFEWAKMNDCKPLRAGGARYLSRFIILVSFHIGIRYTFVRTYVRALPSVSSPSLLTSYRRFLVKCLSGSSCEEATERAQQSCCRFQKAVEQASLKNVRQLADPPALISSRAFLAFVS